MSLFFSDTLKKLRTQKDIRLPYAAMMSRLSGVSGVDVNMLLSAAAQSDECPDVIMVDDSKLLLTGMGFTTASEAVEYAKTNPVALAFLDIELRNSSGLDLCRTLLEINPRTNVVYLTAYSDYAPDAWGVQGKWLYAQAYHTRRCQGAA